LIERDYGFQAIRDMLSQYREGHSTEEVFSNVLSLELDEFDTRFQAYLKERFGAAASSLRLPKEGETTNPSPEELRVRAEKDDHDFFAHLETGRRALADGDMATAEKHLERAKALFPGYGEAGSPYLLLAKIYREKGDDERAASELQSFVDINENHYDAHIELADLYESMGRKEDAAGILERAIDIYPFEPEPHRRLAGLLRDLGRFQEVIVEKRALLALTTDKAQGLYELALAYRDAGDRVQARNELLHALEIAPGFKEGLSLLLELSSEPGEQ
jgi:tetratricopeptide (TPR) repeat protein